MVDVVICFVGFNIFKFFVLVIVKGFVVCLMDLIFVVVIVCENVIGVIDIFVEFIKFFENINFVFFEDYDKCVIFVNLVIDCIVLV